MKSVFHWRCVNLKRQIRRCVFETNSSSMHSLVVMKKASTYSKDEILDGFYLFDDDTTGEKDCVWKIRGDDLEFGRSPFRALGDFHDKWIHFFTVSPMTWAIISSDISFISNRCR